MPRPSHLIYSLLLIAVGTVTIGYGWLFFGFMSSLFGVVMGFTIVVGINWDKAIDYWTAIANVFEKASRIPDTATRYEMLKSMGYNPPPSRIEIVETKKDDGGTYAMDKTIIKGIPPAVLELIASKVLMSGKPDFAEHEYAQFVPAIRKVRKQFRDAGLISQKHKKNVRLGYTFTKKGLDTLYEYAPEGIRLEIMRKEKQ